MTHIKKYLIGNWKMYKTLQESIDFIKELSRLLEKIDTKGLTIGIAPPFVHLSAIANLLEGKQPIQLIAQNCHHEVEGAFTGEVSAHMLAAIGVQGVLIGHSERRIFEKENGVFLAKKITRVLASGMQPLLCCGERLEDRNNGNHEAVVREQLTTTLSSITPDERANVTIAYEPVWAIGTGAVASLTAVKEMHSFIKAMMLEQYGARNIPILYGGSCNPKNAKGIFECPNVAGGLIGSASLAANSFMELVKLLV